MITQPWPMPAQKNGIEVAAQRRRAITVAPEGRLVLSYSTANSRLFA